MNSTDCDRMIIAILQHDDFRDVIDELNRHGFYATVLNSTGGFLKKPNTTIMIGLNHSRLDEALELLKQYGERTQMRYSTTVSGNGMMYSVPFPAAGYPVQCGGVVLFVLHVEQFQKY